MFYPIVIRFVREVINSDDVDNSEFPEDETVNNFNCNTNQRDALCDSMLEQPQTKKRKGQNKCRGRTVPRVKDTDRVCPSILKSEKCKFDKSCKYSHDVKSYIDQRPPDIGYGCINYSTSGYCKYGLECRYGKEHLSADYKNIIDEEKYKSYLEKLGNDNSLSRESMLIIRKKKYEFPRTERFLKSFSESSKSTIENFPENIREKKKVQFFCTQVYNV